jgi:cytochrome c oxidase assembly factor CtaG
VSTRLPETVLPSPLVSSSSGKLSGRAVPWLLGLIASGVAVGAAVAMGGRGYAELSRDYPGLLTAVASTGLWVVVQLAATVCVGALFHAAFLRVRTGSDRLLLDPWSDLRMVRVCSTVWLLASFLLIAVDGADSNGYPLLQALAPGALGYLVQASYLPGAWIVSAVLVAVIVITSNFSRSWAVAVFSLGLGFAALLAPFLVTQVLVGPNHDFGGDATIFGVPATAVFFGTTAVLLFRLLGGHRPSAATVTRYRRVCAVCWPVSLGAVLVVAWFELDGTAPLSTPTGWCFLAEAGLLAALGLNLLAWSRPGRAQAGPGLRFGRYIRRAGLLMALFVGVNVAMTRIPPPQFFVSSSIMELFFGYDVPAAPTPAVLTFDWRLNTLFAVLSAAAVAVYLVGVIRLRRRGDKWPWGRTVSWVLGWFAVVCTTSSGLGQYADAAFSLHMILHMSLNMLCPVLLVMGGPVTLALRAAKASKGSAPAGVHEWVNAFLHWPLFRHLYNPLWVFIEFVSSYYVLYFTPLFEQAMRYHWAHQLFNLHLLVVGYLFYSLVIGLDMPPRPLPHIAKLGMVLAAMPFHAFFGVAVMSSTAIIAEQFYLYLGRPWLTDLHADQYLGGGIAWAAGEIPLLVVVLALLAQWSAQDKRRSRRIDRHLDAGMDESFSAYNDMLASLSERQNFHHGPGRLPDER